MYRRFLAPLDVTSFVFLAADDGQGEGGAKPNDSDGDNSNAGDGDRTGDNAGDASGDETPEVTFKTKAEFQAELDRVVKERLERERQKNERAAEAAKRKAEEDAAAKNGEWQALAEKHAKRLAELEPLETEIESHKSEAEKYKAALTGHLATLKKDLPTPIIALLDNLDPIAQMEWISKNGEEVAGTNGKPALIRAPKADTKNTELTEQQRRERAYKVRF